MARIIGIDFGSKKTGIATTDPLQIIVSSLTTKPTSELFDYLSEYFRNEEVEKIVFGKPTHKDGTTTKLWIQIESFANKIAKSFPKIEVDFADESFSSIRAKEIILQSGAKKRKRQNKDLVDSVSAVIILQQYLGHI